MTFFSLVFLSTFFWSSNVISSENPGLFPVGERESLIGNSGIAGVGSGGALYYNPAALIELEGLSLSVAGYAYLSYSIKTDPFVRVDGTDLNFSASGFTSIPSTAVSTFEWGKDKLLAVGIIIPEALVYNDHQSFSTPNTRTDLAISETAQDLRLGAGFGWRLSPKFSLGFAGFLNRYAKSAQAATTVLNTTSTNTMATSQVFNDLVHYGLQFNVGGQFEFDKQWKAGAVFRLPLLGLGGGAKVLNLSTELNSGTLTESRSLLEDTEVLRRNPWELGLGFSYQPTSHFQLLVDISVQGSGSYKEVPQDTNGSTIDLETQARVSLGSRIGLSENFLLNLGVFYNPSAQRSVVSDNPFDQVLNFVGFSLGGELKTGRTQTSLGLYVAKANNTANVGTFVSDVGASLVSAQVGFTYFLGDTAL